MLNRKIEFDYSKLLGRIKEKYGTQDALATTINISVTSLNYKLNNKIEWKQTEIFEAALSLDIEINDIPDYFFKTKVEKTQIPQHDANN